MNTHEYDANGYRALAYPHLLATPPMVAHESLCFQIAAPSGKNPALTHADPARRGMVGAAAAAREAHPQIDTLAGMGVVWVDVNGREVAWSSPAAWETVWTYLLPVVPSDDASTALRALATDTVSRLLKDDPTSALALFHRLADALPSAEFPEIIVESVTDDGETFMGARCPYCKTLLSDDGVTVIDWGTRETVSDDVNAEVLTFSVDYGNRIEAKFLHYQTTCCERPVTLPGWTED